MARCGKRLIGFLCALTLFLWIPLLCYADSTVSIDEFGFTVDMPSGAFIFTRDTDPSSVTWALLGFEAEELLSYMKENDIYLDAFVPDKACEIVIVGRQSENYESIFNLSLLEDKALRQLLPEFTKGVKMAGLSVDETAIYRTGELTYYSMSATQLTEDQPVYLKSYTTVVNGISVQATLRSYAGSFSGEEEETIKAIVDSIHFREIRSKPASPTSSVESAFSHALPAMITALMISLPLFIIVIIKNTRKEKAKKIKTEEMPEEYDKDLTRAQTNENNTISVNYCGRCGRELPSGSRFCPLCGWKLRD